MKDARVNEIYEELGKLFISLDPDPVSRGPNYLQDVISKTRGYLNQVTFYLTEVLRESHRLEMELEAKESAFQVASDELLANDRRVTSLPSIQDRAAMVNVILANERRDIRSLKRDIKNLGHMERVVKHQHKELESTMSAIRLQRSLIGAELRTGSFYGDESEQSRGSNLDKPGTPQDLSEEEIAKLLREAEHDFVLASAAEVGHNSSEVVEPETRSQVPPEVVPKVDDSHNGSSPTETSEDNDILRFLDGGDDLADILVDL